MTASSFKFLATTGACLLLASCAQTGPPLPPSLELPKPPTDLRGVRKGNRVTLTWSEPTRTTDRQTVRYLGPTLICRSLKAEISGCENPVGQMPSPARATQPTGTQPPPQIFTDILPAAIQEQNPTGEVTYFVEVLNRDQRTAGPSNLVPVAAAPVLPPPADFHPELTTNGVILRWTAMDDAAEGHGVRHRYRIYRREEGSGKELIVGERPFAEPGPALLSDSSLEWEKTYYYRATVVSTAGTFVPGECADQGMLSAADCSTRVALEGDDTPEVKVVAHDVFPPAVPSGLQAVYSGDGQKPFVDLIWAPATDADLAGYNVYRREQGGAATKINSELIKSPSYRDIAVAPGKEYFYSVSSLDVRSNESTRSEEASETVP